jgi:hypothetical protein
LNLSVNLTGSAPSLNEDVSLRLAAVRTLEIAALAGTDSLLAGLETASDAGAAMTPDAARGGTPRQMTAQALTPNLPVLPAGPIPARALHGKDSVGLPAEDWFESSLPAEKISGSGVMESAGLAQILHANLKVSPRLDEASFTRANEAMPQLSIKEMDAKTVSVPFLTTEAKAEAMVARVAPEWNRREWQGIKQDDQLMREIPLLFAPVPLEPQQTPVRMRFKAVVVNGLLMLGAILAAILVGTLTLKDLPSVKTMELAAVALAVVGALYWMRRWVKQHGA